MSKRIGLKTAMVVLGIAPAPAGAVTGDAFEFNAYLRAGVRANNSDTPACFKNKGPAASINEFRLGNECEDYGELGLTAFHVKGKGEDDKFFKTRVTLNFVTPGHTHTEPLGAGLIEAYVMGGNFEGSRLKYWVGKKLFRETPAYMNDDFYFASTNGNGAGVQDMGFLPTGKLALAYFLEQTNPNPPTAGATTRYQGNYFDLRWSDLALTDDHRLDLWTMYGNTRGGTLITGASGTESTSYLPSSGVAAGVRHRFLLRDGCNYLSVQYGNKLLQGLGLANIVDAQGSMTIGGSERLRLVEDLVMNTSSSFAIEVVARYERFRAGASLPSGVWADVGTRPIYSFTDHFGLAAELGFSSVKYESDAAASTLQRVTISPEIRLDRKYLTRPLARAYYTTSFNRGSAFGVQAEVWF